jgi:hypothetical protein
MPGGAALVTSPAHLSRAAGLAPLSPAQRPALILSAGAPLAESAACEARAFLTTPITEIFGSTETGAIAWRPRDGEDARAPARCQSRQPGRLLHAAAPHIPDEPGRAGQTLADQIEMAAGGTFRLNGRSDRIAKIEGARVSLDELERALTALPEIERATVIALPGETAQLAAAAVPSEAGAQHLAAVGAFRFGRYLRSALAQRLPPAALPKRWRFASFPENVGGREQHENPAFQSRPHSRPRYAHADPWSGPAPVYGCEIDCAVPPDLSYFTRHFCHADPACGADRLGCTLANQYLSLELEAACAFQVKFRHYDKPVLHAAFARSAQPAPCRSCIDGETASSWSRPAPSTRPP